MMDRAAQKYLWDARQAADRIARFTALRTFDDYLSDEMLRAAVERQFEIIGEALSGLRRVAPGIASIIPDLSRIIAFRNILIHGYASVDDRLVWGVVETELPKLREALERCMPIPRSE
ncbi:MAG TPA: HepT-like ribonuclease domain-containing protein [Rhizomicrobium sp.]|nr:HepT-like ribonuclease domain-containing protein [Rhizomicrobium sp.]